MNQENAKGESRVLIVDDAGIVRLACERALNKAGFQVGTAESAEQALTALQKEPVHVVLLDLKMPKMNGLELMRLLRQMWPQTEIVIMTAYADNIMVEETRKLGAMDVIIKPFDDIKRLVKILSKAALRSRLRQKEPVDSAEVLKAVLLEPGWTEESEFQKAVRHALDRHISLRRALLDLEVISEQDLDWAFASFLDVPYVHLDFKMLDPLILRDFPFPLARKYSCVPLFKEEGVLHLVIANPFNDEAVKEIEACLNMPVMLYKGAAPEIRIVIEALEKELGAALPALEIAARLRRGASDQPQLLISTLFRNSSIKSLERADLEAMGDGQYAFSFQGVLDVGLKAEAEGKLEIHGPEPMEPSGAKEQSPEPCAAPANTKDAR